MTDKVSALQLMPGWTNPCGETVSRSSTTLSVKMVSPCWADTTAMFPNDASRLMQMIGRMCDFMIEYS